MTCGTPLFAATTVRVIAVGGADSGGFGPLYPTLRLPDGHDVLLGHVQQTYVNVGNTYPAGTHLSDAGTEGNSTGCHLHFEVRPGGGRYGSDINPSPYLKFTPTASSGPDFNGDGRADLAVGVPGEASGAGAINVMYSSGSVGLINSSGAVADEFITQNTPSVDSTAGPGEQFGAALAAGDFNGDGRADLAVGVPGEASGVGAINVLYSSGSVGLINGAGAVADEFITQETPSVDSGANPGERFGAALAAGDFNVNGRTSLAVGVPGEASGAGAINVLYSSGAVGLINASGAVADEFISQNTPSVDSDATPGDQFGAALAAGDFNVNGRTSLAVGVPGEASGAGAINVLYSSGAVGLINSSGAVADEFITQNTPSVDSTAGPGEQFGAAFATGDFNVDGRADLAVGVPGEASGVGAINVLYSSGAVGLINGAGAVADEFITQETPSVDSGANPDEHFGASLSK